MPSPRLRLFCCGEIGHRGIDALELAAGDFQVARLRCAAAQDDGVEIAAKVFDLHVEADVGVGLEGDPLGLHQLDAAIDDFLFELEVGDAVHEQAADAVGALEDGDPVAGLVELSRGGQARRAGADDGDFLARAPLGRLRLDPAVARRHGR